MTNETSRLSRANHPTRMLTPDQRLWQLWRQGQRPDLVTFLAGCGSVTPEQAAAVISIDQYERWAAGERVPAERYLALLPAGTGAEQAACDIIYGEYLLLEQLGEPPVLEVFQVRFPQQAELLARQVELHHALAIPSGSLDSPEFPSTVTADAKRNQIQVPQVAGYEILGELGRGGMGVVYKARQISLDRVVALKVLRRDPAADPQALDRMRREAHVTAQLSDPHIVTVHDAGEAGDFFFFAMEYVPGVDLHRLVESDGPLSIERACEYIRQAALGLQHAHEQGLVHRDIKPSNLMVTNPTGPPTESVVKILDLGLARTQMRPDIEPTGDDSLTRLGSFMGTPDFIAPEQANDPRQADVRSDLYSLGCTLYYLLTTHPPFSGPTPLAKLVKHHTQDPPPLESLRSGVPVVLSRIARKLLAKNPQDRFQTPIELARALAGLVRGKTPLPPTRLNRGGVGELLHRLEGHSNWVKAVAFLSEECLVSCGMDGLVRGWDVTTGEREWTGQGPTEGLLSLACSPDGTSLVTGGADACLYQWDAVAGRAGWKASGHQGNVNTVAYLPSGEQILSGSHDGTLRLWDARTGRALAVWTAHAGVVWSLVVTRSGLAISSGQDRLIRVWNVKQHSLHTDWPEQPSVLQCLHLSADGRFLVAGGAGGDLFMVEVANHREVMRFEGHTEKVISVALSPDGKNLLSGSRDGTLRLWDIATGLQRQTFEGHRRWVSGVAWSPDGALAASGGVDGSVRLWQMPG